MDAVGEALLQHYNVGISNPWYEAGLSDQETYNRRKLPWAGKNYSVDGDGNVSGPNAESLPDGLVASWNALAVEAQSTVADSDGYEGLQDMYDTLTEIDPDPSEFM